MSSEESVVQPTSVDSASPDGPGPATVAAHGNQRISREEILDVAVHMFSRNGYRATNLGDVAAELGVTRQALYYYFKKKDDILVALFHYVFDELERSVGAIDSGDGSPCERLNQMLRAHLRVVSKYPSHISLILREQEALPAEKRHDMAARRWTYHTRFMSVYEQAVAEGACADVPSDFAVSLLISAANMTYPWLSRVGVVDSESFASMTQQFLANGYLTPARRPEAGKSNR